MGKQNPGKIGPSNRGKKGDRRHGTARSGKGLRNKRRKASGPDSRVNDPEKTDPEHDHLGSNRGITVRFRISSTSWLARKLIRKGIEKIKIQLPESLPDNRILCSWRTSQGGGEGEAFWAQGLLHTLTAKGFFLSRVRLLELYRTDLQACFVYLDFSSTGDPVEATIRSIALSPFGRFYLSVVCRAKGSAGLQINLGGFFNEQRRKLVETTYSLRIPDDGRNPEIVSSRELANAS